MRERKRKTGDESAPGGTVRDRFSVGGIVQGVGFRPFVYRLAHELGLAGNVTNTVHGVEIEVEGSAAGLEAFARGLRSQAPPMARVGRVQLRRIEPLGETTFVITSSPSGPGRTAPVAPDSGTCPDCLAELRDPSDRRWRYPFINCTNCGPRYTIITNIPYDRPNTTMASFAMCPACRAEYEDPLDRRFHAQPNACPVCGPRAWLSDPSGHMLPCEPGLDVLQMAGRLLLEDKILAVKGLGGFHLACLGTSGPAVSALRARKRRQGKPFALMFPDVAAVSTVCRIAAAARAALHSPRRPILLLPKRKRPELQIAEQVAPGMAEHGVMLPYTPLHYLLLDAVGGAPLVMTSGNLSDEPIVIDNSRALESLAGVADYFLLHDRPIHMRNDDSVLRVAGRKPFPVRRSRGFAPEPIRLGRKLPPVLAVGGHLKNTVCLLRGRDAFISQHVGDLDGNDSYRFFSETVAQMLRLYEFQPDRVACDLHPSYLTTRWARRDSGCPVVAVQHHHAHIVSCMAEHGLRGNVLGVAFDGTGYGPDGTLWGGEFLLTDEKAYTRLGHLPEQVLPGGEAAIRYPWRSARAIFGRALGRENIDDLELWREIGGGEVSTVDRMLERKTNCPRTTGCGRLFDAVAAVLGVCAESLYEGQAAVELEALAARSSAAAARKYGFELCQQDGVLIPELTAMLAGIVKDCRDGVRPEAIARGFHECLADLAAETASLLSEKHCLKRVVLSGGVFNNRLLVEGLTRRLRSRGLKVYTHRAVPPGDGGISLGQAVIAAHAD